MARQYSFDIDSLLEDLRKQPHYQNTKWGTKYGISRERVRQIKEKAIRRLKHTSRSKILKTYLG